MLKIQVIAIGKVKEDWMRQGIAEYQKRLGAYCRFEIIELEEYRLPDNPSEAEIARGLEEEGNRILKKAAGLIFPLCIEGEMLSSPQLAQLISSSAQKSGCLSFIIGGSFGLSPRVRRPLPGRSAFLGLPFRISWPGCSFASSSTVPAPSMPVPSTTNNYQFPGAFAGSGFLFHPAKCFT